MWPENSGQCANVIHRDKSGELTIAREICSLGMGMLHAGRVHAAGIQFRKALGIAPQCEEALFLLGYCLHLSGDYDEALSAYDQVLAVSPRHVAAWNNRGNTLLKLSRHEEAAESYTRALRLEPGLHDARIALATCYQALGLIKEAMSACNEVLAAVPEHAEAHWNRSLLLLLNGEYREGWREYEWRWKKRGFTSPSRRFDQPCWQGEEITGKVILVHAEQGFGDTLQFCRYVPLLSARGARVVLECQAPLVPLLSTVAGVSAVIPTGEMPGRFDLQAPMLSLPGIFGTSLENIPTTVPYVAPPPDRLHFWSTMAGNGKRLRVGLCWAGKSYPDPGRSCPADQLAPLADVNGVAFHSLQVGREGAVPFAMIDHTGLVRDFADSAALIAQLDLVVTVDTAVAHLAGAMGKPAWVLLPYSPDWRWLLDRDDSPWYPSLRLFRQSSRGSWQDVVQRVKSELLNKLAFPGENHLNNGRIFPKNDV